MSRIKKSWIEGLDYTNSLILHDLMVRPLLGAYAVWEQCEVLADMLDRLGLSPEDEAKARDAFMDMYPAVTGYMAYKAQLVGLLTAVQRELLDRSLPGPGGGGVSGGALPEGAVRKVG